MASIVYILESPSPDDFLTNTQEGDIISNSLSLTDIPNLHFKIINRDCLKKIISEISDYIDQEPHSPIIHISSHGNKEGIALTGEDELVTWPELRDLLRPLSRTAHTKILLCFSTCFGVNAYRMAASFGKVFDDAVGPVDTVGWSETAVAYTTFYHLLLQKGYKVKDAVEMMNASIAQDKRFVAISGEAVRSRFRNQLKNTLVARLNAARNRREESR